MVARYAKSYIDRVYEAKDLGELYGLIEVVSRNRELPEQFWLFQRLHEWLGLWFRSGVWQHYECISESEVEKTARTMERFGLNELAEKYRSGLTTWDEAAGQCKELDNWISEHEKELDYIAFDLIAQNRDYLYDEK